MMLRFWTTTIGCKVNQYETQSLAALLRRSGMCDADDPAKGTNLAIINTCCVTASAAAKSRRAIRQAVRNNPNADIIILGCYATAEGENLRQVAIDAGAKGEILALGHHDNIAEHLQRYLSTVDDPGRGESVSTKPARAVRNEKCMRENSSQRPAKDSCNSTSIEPTQPPPVKKNNTERGTFNLPPIETFANHQRAFVKVQDGCDAFCTYCVIPRLRSCVWSRPTGEILDEAKTLVANGHREIVLCGVFLGAYDQPTTIRRKWAGPSALPELLRQVAQTPGLWRVRLSSLEPGDVTDELLGVLGDCPTVAPHLHLPMQSGSSRILKRMNRQYSREQFLDALRRVRKTIDDAAITTDVVVGFPGESDADFADTMDVARKSEFSKIHTFPFSPRPGTAAWNWRTESAPPEVVKARCAKLNELEREMSENFRRRFVGQTVEALVEQPNSKTPPSHTRALTDRYIEVVFPSDLGAVAAASAATPERPDINVATNTVATAPGQVIQIQITDLSETGLRGRRER